MYIRGWSENGPIVPKNGPKNKKIRDFSCYGQNIKLQAHLEFTHPEVLSTNLKSKIWKKEKIEKPKCTMSGAWTMCRHYLLFYWSKNATTDVSNTLLSIEKCFGTF